MGFINRLTSIFTGKQIADEQVLLGQGSGYLGEINATTGVEQGLGNITGGTIPQSVPTSGKLDSLKKALTHASVKNPGKKIDENTLNNSEIVYACVDYITKASSQAVPRLYKFDKKGNKVPVRNAKLNRWIESPNPFTSWTDTIELLIQGLLLSGNSFLTFEEVGTEFESWFLSAPHRVQVVPDPEEFIKGYIYGDVDSGIAYDVEDIIHLKNPTLNNPYYGQSTVRPLFDTLVLEALASDEMSTFYKNSAILTGVLQSEYGIGSAQLEAISEQFKNMYGKKGSNRRGVAVLPNGLKYNTVQASPKDAMLLDTLNISETRIMRAFKLHPIVLGGAPGATTHTRELMQTVFNTAVRPFLYKVQEQITHFLRQQKQFKGIYFEFDLDRIVELDSSYVNKAQAVIAVSNSGLTTANESRDILGLPRVDDERFDSFLIPQHLYGANVIMINPATGEQSIAGSVAETQGQLDGLTGDGVMNDADNTISGQQ